MCLAYIKCLINVSCFSSLPPSFLHYPHHPFYYLSIKQKSYRQIVYYCVASYHSQQLKTTHGYYFMVSVGQESRASLARFSTSGSHQAEIWVSVEAPVSSEAWLGQDLLPSSLMLLVKFISLQLWIWDPCFLAWYCQLLEVACSSLQWDHFW